MTKEIYKEMEDQLNRVNRNPWLPVYVGLGVVLTTAIALGTLLLFWYKK